MSIEKEKTIDHRMMYEGKLLHVYYDEVDIAGEIIDGRLWNIPVLRRLFL